MRRFLPIKRLGKGIVSKIMFQLGKIIELGRRRLEPILGGDY
jgi:hypothetical protein